MKQNTKRLPIKGTSRRVVIVRGEDDSLFEQIVYFVRDERFAGRGISADMVLREAIDSLQPNAPDEPGEDSSASFSRVLLVLLLIAFALTIGILLFFHFYGWN